MDDRNVLRHLRNDNDISWVCQFCGLPFPWEVQTETFRHHLTRMCESAPEDVKEAAQRIEEEAVEADEFSASVEGNDSNFKAKTEGSKYECQKLQGVEVSSVKRIRREGIVQSSNKRQRSTPDALPIVAALEVPMVEGIQDTGESASLTKRPVVDAFKEAVQRREVETAECSRSVEVNREPTKMASSSPSATIREVRLASSSYDVFLSFRGEDTRKGFISHLRAALDKKQILTFDDENMNRGAGISPSILTAIEKSTISLVIFSENYADSKWCLKELAKILRCKELNGQIVIPVFYGVDPSDIKKQTGKFGLAFDKLKERLREGEMDLNEVSSHLKEAANIAGWNSQIIRLECELITLIVQNIDDALKVLKRQSASLTKRLVGDEGQLQKLKVTLRTVTKVIGDAEQKQFSDRDVREWLDNLKDAAFRAEDFLDEIDYEVLKWKIESGGAQTSADADMSVGEMEPRLKEINETLEHLVKQRGPLGLEEKNSTLKLDASSPTSSLVDASYVYGRDGDKEGVVELLRSDDGIGMNVGVVLIVGMGGMGKTTLTQLVFKDDWVLQCFDVRAWVYVPKELKAFQVTRDIMKEVGLGNDIDKMTANQMHCELERKLSGKKVLLVLDDVWVATQGEWDSLMKPFMSVKQGSKIIITTRHSSVARIMRSDTIHCLAGLNEDNCWLLFAKYAFGNEGYHEYPALEKIGREMVKKCNGLPLAAKALGGILRSERRVERWKKILNNNIWASTNDEGEDEVLPALRLSYSYLPSSLKQCFAYCAMFPKNYQFEKEELVLLWVAEGFIAPSRRGEDMEMTGERYFEDLVSRSFLQQQSLASGKTVFTMHDLLNDMATLVSREFCSRLEAVNSLEVTQRTRYLSYSIKRGDDQYGIEDLKCILGKPHFLRTLFLMANDNLFEALKRFNLLEALKSLRVLHLSCYVELPDSIGILKYLRYLRFGPNNIQQLPESICKLYNLQILIMRGSPFGALTKLPNNMSKLVNLFLLDIRDLRLQEMPPHMGELTKLQKLNNFVVGKQKQAGSSSGIKELEKLNNLRGRLCVEGLQNVVDLGDAMGAILRGKQHLEELELKWDHGEDNSNCSLHQQRVLEKLVPHTDLKSLFVYGYGGERFADWVGDSSFSCMVSLKIENCKILSLPPVCRLASLERLTIESCDGVTSIGSELHSMKKLRYLRIRSMQEWCKWISDGDDSETNFPLLQELEIGDCPKLRKALPSHLPSVAKIKIESCEQLEMKCFSLECFPILKKLKIRNCPKLVSFCKGRSPNFSSNLASLKLNWCPNLKVLPESRLCSNLETLRIWCCPEIEFSPTNLGVHLGGSNSKLRQLTVQHCKKLLSRRHEWGLEMLPSLIDLKISGCDEVEESFPEKTMLLPSTLTSLEIGRFPNLKSLNYDGLQPLTSLRSLVILCCHKLQSLQPNQNQKLPTSLYLLDIRGCRLLTERCQPEKGVDWPFISHIPYVAVNGTRIRWAF